MTQLAERVSKVEIFLASRRCGEGRDVSFLVISSCVGIPGWVAVIVQTSGEGFF